MLILGIDCGKEGALVLVDGRQPRIVTCWDMPLYHKRVGKTVRELVDPVSLLQQLEVAKDLGAALAVIEDPGNRPGQANLLKFGWSIGLVHMATVAAGIPFEFVVASAWKAKMKCPADKFGAVQRADAVFPDARAHFRGRLGGMKDGRAEASLIACYGYKYIALAGLHMNAA